MDGQKKAIHRLRRAKHSLFADGSRGKTGGPSKKRDIEGGNHCRRLHEVRAGEVNDRSLTIGYSVLLQKPRGATIWSTNKPSTADIPNKEIEYQTMVTEVQDAVYLR